MKLKYDIFTLISGRTRVIWNKNHCMEVTRIIKGLKFKGDTHTSVFKGDIEQGGMREGEI